MISQPHDISIAVGFCHITSTSSSVFIIPILTKSVETRCKTMGMLSSAFYVQKPIYVYLLSIDDLTVGFRARGSMHLLRNE